MKKLLLGIGSLAAIAAPVVAVVSCESYDPDKIWSVDYTYTMDDSIADATEIQNIKDVVLDEAMKLNKESGKRYEVHVRINEVHTAGTERYWTGSVVETSFGKTKTEVRNDVNRKIDEFRDWSSANTSEYESTIYNESRNEAKRIFDEELAYARGLTHADTIKINIYRHREGIHRTFTWNRSRGVIGSPATVFDGIPGIEEVFPPSSQIGQP